MDFSVVEIALAAVLTVFTGLLVFTNYRTTKLQRDFHRAQYDPELMMEGEWYFSCGEECDRWVGEVYLCNTGPTPIVITMRDYDAEQPCKGLAIYDRASFERAIEMQEPPSEIFPPIMLPGHSHKWVKIVIHAKNIRTAVLTYSTSLSKDKKLVKKF